MSATPKTGAEMQLCRNTGTVAVPVWSEVADIGDVSIPDLAMGLAEIKRRGNKWTKNLPTLIQSFTVEFRLTYGMDATTFTALKTAFLAGTPAEYLVCDGDPTVTGAQGWRLPALVSEFPWDQPLEDVSGHDMKLAVAYMEDTGTEVDPSWFTAA